MTSCAEQQQTLDRADFIYLNCNPTLHKKKINPCAKKKDLLFQPSLPLRQLRCLLAHFIMLSSKTTLNYRRIRTDAMPVIRRAAPRADVCVCPRPAALQRRSLGRPGSARLPGRGGSALLPGNGACRSPPPFPRSDPPAGSPPRLTWQTWGPPAPHPSSAGTCFPRSGAASAEGRRR